MADAARLSVIERIDAARGDRMVASFVGDDAFDADPGAAWADPSRKMLAGCRDEDLSAIIAREPTSRTGLLAASIMTNRNNWRSPAKYSLIVSLIAVLIAAAAFIRTL
jgi:hypothetical protein